MKEAGILFVLIQIAEAHSSAWPVGLEDQPEPQQNIQDRLERANKFVTDDNVPFPVYVDTWSDNFSEMYQSWPDKYYLVDYDMRILMKSEYGTGNDHPDALIRVDSLDLVKQLLRID